MTRSCSRKAGMDATRPRERVKGRPDTFISSIVTDVRAVRCDVAAVDYSMILMLPGGDVAPPLDAGSPSGCHPALNHAQIHRRLGVWAVFSIVPFPVLVAASPRYAILSAMATVYREKAILVGVLLAGREAGGKGTNSGLPEGPGPRPDPLEELEQLALTAGAEVRDKILQRRERPDSATYVGSGKAREIGERAEELDCDAVLFDNDLSPAQVRNLEKAMGRKVLDRSEVILDIFATHARTNEAKLQVELAQLEYSLPRLKNLWSHLERIVAGHSSAGGGIGTRGPGEQQIEVDRRLARKRVTDLKRELERIAGRKRREIAGRAANYTVALVGYTNAGKSTLMRALTGADVLVEDKLFSTLDTRTRTWRLPNRQRILISDTVGFIRDLPHHLVASFHATLEEVATADLLLHVVDASHAEAARHIAAVRSVLGKLGCGEARTIGVLNKADRAGDRLALALLEREFAESVSCSAKTGEGLDRLAAAVERGIADRFVERELVLPAGDGRILAELSRFGTVLDHTYEDEIVRVRVRMPIREAGKYDRYASTKDGKG